MPAKKIPQYVAEKVINLAYVYVNTGFRIDAFKDACRANGYQITDTDMECVWQAVLANHKPNHDERIRQALAKWKQYNQNVKLYNMWMEAI